MKVVTMKTEARDPKGTTGARRSRRAGRMPAVVYGDGATPMHVSLDARDFTQAVERGARVIDLDGGDGATRVLLKDLQFDPLGVKMIHADFLRVNPNNPIELRIPVELRGVPAGLSKGGILSIPSNAILVRCLPKDLPDNVVLNIEELALGKSIAAGDIELPEGVTCADEANKLLVTIIVPRGISDDEAVAEGEGEGGEAAAPAAG